MKSLIFSTEDVLAWKEGKKTIHFVKMRPQPIIRGGVWYPHDKAVRAFHYATEQHFREGVAKDFSPYRPGDKVYVSETWRYSYHYGDNDYCPCYRADNTCKCGQPSLTRSDAVNWRPPLHLREIDARFHAIIKSVKPEEVDGVWYWKIKLEKGE